jgi:hypothetical protein
MLAYSVQPGGFDVYEMETLLIAGLLSASLTLGCNGDGC